MNKKIYQWTVVGAGPAGIAAVGKLIDAGVLVSDILWLDPAFSVGDLGSLWQNVSSNTSVKLFHQFLNAVGAFQYPSFKDKLKLATLPTNQTCLLKYMVEPLRIITEMLKNKVNSATDWVEGIALKEQCWQIKGRKSTYVSEKLILATGAEPSRLLLDEVNELPFVTAIDKEKLAQAIDTNQTYAVFGSSHSAIMIVRHLVELKVKKVINFYRSPLIYALDLGDWILFDNTGLKGETAFWARENIDGGTIANLTRCLANEQNVEAILPSCHQVIYAVGFHPRHQIHTAESCLSHYNPHVGIIAPGLFGFGIGFPEQIVNRLGQTEHQVGLWKFMTYLEKVLPIWLQYPTAKPEKK